MSYGLNVEMQKQTEIAKRLSAICAQLVPYLSQEVNNLTFNYLYAILKFLRFIFSSNLKAPTTSVSGNRTSKTSHNGRVK